MFIFNETPETFSKTINGTIDHCEAGRLRVKALGSIWNATLQNACDEMLLSRGQTVQVVGRKGICLIVAL